MSTTQLSVNREATRRRILLTLKKYSYLIAMVPLVLPPLLLAAGHWAGSPVSQPYWSGACWNWLPAHSA